MKGYTDLAQSKKLAEILPIKSADACWTNHMFNTFLSSWRIESTPPQEYKYILDRFVIRGYLIEPAWSLAALLEIMPAKLEDNHYLTLDKESYKEFDEYCCCYEDCNGDSFHDFFGKNPIDACYEMILKLHELKML